ncbi:PQQ-dependent sugar dehydrogenase [Halopelagius longus]|uniref:Glucose / Sorbosone dehydrogenase n=1 Tax=Halopelagius longus TaxID=1236180 RepID=A0A1H1GRL7_9EURY|nr:PQQ-dependent sugar dehydrogenase [Halopelagius longus]RDI69522.1 hypothetical protein DWB78_18870 [Halopelagius longus]SDR15852.1 Glucose / Sorbosone dehydrogenase [Halopelagius longus]
MTDEPTTQSEKDVETEKNEQSEDGTDGLGGNPSRRRLLQATGAIGASAALPISVVAATESSSGDDDAAAGFFEKGVDVSLEEVAGGLTAPTSFAVAEEDRDRWFVTDQTGQAYYCEDGELHEFISVKDRIVELGNMYGQFPPEKPGLQYDERGLLGIEFHPDFQENRKFYLHYSGMPDEELPDRWDHYTVLAEYEANEDTDSADPESERLLLHTPHPQMNHNAGPMAFGPDDYLYFPIGDGGGKNDTFYGHVDDWFGLNGGGNGQDVSENIYGSILRLDVDDTEGDKPYGIPDDNPLVGTDGLDEIYAWGFRNPFGISFDSHGNLFQADAGEALFEEVNIVLKGGNYGWNIKEGTHCFDAENHDKPPKKCPDYAPSKTGDGVEPLIDPIVEFPHEYKGEKVGEVVIGGHRYEGDAIPELQDKYVYGAFFKNPKQSKGRLLTASPPDGQQGEVTLEDLEPDFPDDPDVPSEFINPSEDEISKDEMPSDALIDKENKKNEVPRDELWDMAQMNVVENEDGMPDYYVRQFGRDHDGELYVLVNDKLLPKGETGKVLKIVPPDQEETSQETTMTDDEGHSSETESGTETTADN